MEGWYPAVVKEVTDRGTALVLLRDFPEGEEEVPLLYLAHPANDDPELEAADHEDAADPEAEADPEAQLEAELEAAAEAEQAEAEQVEAEAEKVEAEEGARGQELKAAGQEDGEANCT